jgi:hypothetical protein
LESLTSSVSIGLGVYFIGLASIKSLMMAFSGF